MTVEFSKGNSAMPSSAFVSRFHNLAPLVFINGADTKAAQMFTLAHELAHIWLGVSAVSDAQASQAPEHEVESWCNRVAAELLVPLDAMRAEYKPRNPLGEEIIRLARSFKVSTLVVLRRIHDAGGLTQDEFWRAYRKEVERLRGMPAGSGGDFYLTLGARAANGSHAPWSSAHGREDRPSRRRIDSSDSRK